jgi:NAD+ kinase
MKIGIVSRTDKDEAVELSRRVVSLLEGHDIYVDGSLQEFIDKPVITDVDAIVVIGGDGTILRACSQYGETPLLTVNMGTYGFLCELTPDEVDTIPSILDDHYLDTRKKLSVTYEDEPIGTVLNEVVVRSTSPIKMDHLAVCVGDETHEIYGDGVIVATPTGSTAYSLSAGGSIVHEKAEVIIITPICPLFREAFPYIVPDTFEIVVSNRGKDSYVIIDGQPVIMFQEGEHITITAASQCARFIRRA